MAAFPGVAEVVAAEFGFQPKELLAGGRLRSWSLSHARSIAMWIAYETGDVTLTVLAGWMGIIYPTCRAQVQKVARRCEDERQFRALCNRLLRSATVVK